ncbi:MAG: hypothetical protein RI957_1909 [Verrucomicrobiota bacterium]|jgi:hypothetical protein
MEVDSSKDRTKEAKALDRTENREETVMRLQAFRVVDTESQDTRVDTVVTLKGEPNRHTSYEGKSIDKNIDELLQPDITYDPNFLEHSWDKRKPVVRRGWQILVTSLLLFAGFKVYQQIEANRRLEQTVHSSQKNAQDREVDVAKDLVKSIETTVRRYFAASSIEEKIPLIRYADQTRERMKHHYARSPLQPEAIDAITKLEPVTLDHRTFWRVFVRKSNDQTEMILLEQMGESQVLVDWDSQVDYQALPWEKYLEEKPNIAMSYRLDISESARPIAEFSNEQTWVCYCLTKSSSDKILFGYVRRGSDPHLAIETARSLGSHRMILRLQASSTLKAEDSVVIQEVMSGTVYRVTPPKSLYD